MTKSGRYLVSLFIAAMLLFGATWLISLYGRQVFLAPESGAWRARLEMIGQCDLGETVVIGDSRAGAAFLPQYFSEGVRNFGFGGVTPAEDYFFAKKILACKRLPTTVIIAISPFQFHRSRAYLWDQSVAFGGLNASDLAELAANEEAHGWHYFYDARFGSEPPAAIKNWLYINRFPPFDFAAMLKAFGGNRKELIQAAYVEAKRKRGALQWPNVGKCFGQFFEEKALFPSKLYREKFIPNPEMAFYFNKMLTLLNNTNIKVTISPIPISAFVSSQLTDTYTKDYMSFLSREVLPFENIQLPDAVWTIQNNCDFSDGTHLSENGAKNFSEIFKTMRFHR